MIGEVVVEYAAGGSQFTATVPNAMNCVPPCFTNAGEYIVWYRVANPNYEDFAHTAKVTITPKALTDDYVWLLLPTEGYVYDGNAKIPSMGFGDGVPSIITCDDFDVTS